jgi:hypothetical protein
MKSYDGAGCTRMALLFAISTSAILIASALFLLLERNFLGLNAASTLLKNGGETVNSKINSFTESNPVTSGLIK